MSLGGISHDTASQVDAIANVIGAADQTGDGADQRRPAVEARDIYKRFGALEVLRGVSLEAHRGDVVSIIGASGSGKTTLLRCLNMLEVPDGGSVKVDGEEIRLAHKRDGRRFPADEAQVNRIRTRLGMVFQSFNLWTHMTVLDNVIEAPVHVLRRPKGEMREIGRALLDKVGIGEKADSYPDQLSGGQQQRAAIARALAMEPALLLFDEPTSALDPELVGEVLLVMRGLAAEGRTMVIVTHEMPFAREVSSHVMFLHNGKVEEEGSPEQVFDNPSSERCRQFLATNY